MHLAYAIDNLGSGGAQRQSVELACHLRREAGVEVSFLVYRDLAFHAQRLREAGIPVFLLRKRGQLDPWFPVRVRQWLEGHPVDAIHAFLPMPCLWYFLGSRMLRKEVRPGFVAAERSAMEGASWPYDWARRLVYKHSDAVTVNAQRMVGELEAHLGVRRERIHFLPNGIDLAAWDLEASEPCPLELEAGRFHLALVGGLRREKNHSLVLDALEILGPEATRDWRVWFVGEETGEAGYAQGIRAEIERRDLAGRVRVVPPVRGIAALMSRLDGVLLPSAFEGFPNVVLEAMASRTPVIASSVGEVPNLIEHGRTGFLLDRADAKSLASALAALYALPGSARSALGARAREVVEARYAMAVVASRYLELYREVSRGREGRR